MRPTHKNRSRNRHRSGGGSGGGGGGGGGNPLTRVYESNGPDVKVRGTAQTIADKYLQLGRDAQSSGDIVMAESYFQHAEHYLRIVFAAQAYNQQAQQQYRRPEDEFDDEDLEDHPEAAVELRNGQQAGGEPEGMGEQPSFEGAPERQPQQNQQLRQPREPRDFNREGRDNRDNRETRESRDTRDSRDTREQGRDRFRPRWQDRRNEGQQGQAGEPRQNQQAPQPRQEEQPRIEQAPQPAPVAAAAPAAEPDRWEAPSFLRRPAPAPAPVVEAQAEEPPAPAAPAKRKYERRPRKEAQPEQPAAAVADVKAPAAD